MSLRVRVSAGTVNARWATQSGIDVRSDLANRLGSVGAEGQTTPTRPMAGVRIEVAGNLIAEYHGILGN